MFQYHESKAQQIFLANESTVPPTNENPAFAGILPRGHAHFRSYEIWFIKSVNETSLPEIE